MIDVYTRKSLFLIVTYFVTSFPKNVTFGPSRYETFLNGKKYNDSAGTETCFLFPFCHLFVLTLFIFKAPNYVLAQTLTERVE